MGKIDNCCKLLTAVKPIFAMVGIVAIELVALSNGIDGVALSACIAALAGLGGYYLIPIREKLGELRKR